MKESPDWNFASGEETRANIGGVQLIRDYFTCGTYFFDGRYKMVKFPAGMILYHGSKALAEARVSFPVGVSFYDRNNDIGAGFGPRLAEIVAASDDSVEKILAEYFKISPAWFADLKTAKLYSKMSGCNAMTGQTDADFESCVMAYKLKRDATFMLIDDPYNIWKMLNDDSLPTPLKISLREMFLIDQRNAPRGVTVRAKNYGDLSISELRRFSVQHVDSSFADKFCKLASELKIAGYAADFPITDAGEKYFHLEFMFCDAFDYLERDTSNVNDANRVRFDQQLFDLFFPETREFLRQMRLYKSTNFTFHAGNLFEHSIWCELYAESLMNGDDTYAPTEETKRFVAACALIHDIGKMSPSETRARRKDFIYFSVPPHPMIGKRYVTGQEELPVVDENNVSTRLRALNVREMLNELLPNVSADRITLIGLVVEYHWELENFIRNVKSKTMSVSQAADAYVKLVSDVSDEEVGELPFLYYYALIVVSVADVLATQPFEQDEEDGDFPTKSELFDFVYNVPKNYKGGNVAEESAELLGEMRREVLARCWRDTFDHEGFTGRGPR